MTGTHSIFHRDSLRLARARRGLVGPGFLLGAALLALPHPVFAADPQPYVVTIKPTGEPALDAAIKGSATLLTLRDNAPVGSFGLVARARGDVGRITEALHSYGYYLGSVGVVIAGRDLDDPALPALLDAAPAKPAAVVVVTVTPNQLFHLGQVRLTGDVPSGSVALLHLAPGAPARAADVLAARDRLLGGLLDAGRALARVDSPVATLDVAHNTLDVSYAVAAGPRVDLGPITVAGEQTLRESYIRRRLPLQPGQRFDPRAIEAARQDLAAVPVLGGVRITPADALDAAGRLPVRVDVTERPLRAVTLSGAFSTDQGGSLTAAWTHRNLFGNAEQLTLSAAATQLGGSASRQPGYNVGATLLLPDWLARNQSLTFGATALQEYLQAYERTAILGSAIFSRRITPELTLSGGLSTELAQIRQEGARRTYNLVQAPLTAAYDSTGSLFDPVHGVRVSLNVTPSLSLPSGGRGSSVAGTGRSAEFVVLQASGSTYLDMAALFGGQRGRSVLAVRGLVGEINGAQSFDVPPDQRFYAGGGGTVRGYRFQSVGPHFADGVPAGGTSVEVGTLEYRQRFGASYGAVVFADAGQVGASSSRLYGANTLRIGAGAGFRYYTPIGPIRLDVAVPLNKDTREKTDIVEAYIGIGQAF